MTEHNEKKKPSMNVHKNNEKKKTGLILSIKILNDASINS